MMLIVVFTDIVGIEKFNNLPFKSKHSFLNKFFDDLDKFNLKKEKSKCVW